MTLRQFTDSVWFRLLARSFAIAGGLIATVVVPLLTVFFFSNADRITAIEIDRKSRISVTDARLTAIDAKLAAMTVDVGGVADDQEKIARDVARIAGVIEGMGRRDEAVSMLTPRTSTLRP